MTGLQVSAEGWLGCTASPAFGFWRSRRLSTSRYIYGTPQQPGSYAFTVRLTDSLGVAATKAFTLTVN